MDKIDYDKYNVELVYDDSDNKEMDELLQELLKVLNDRSIPEGNKQSVRRQVDEILKTKSILSKPPKVVLTPKK